MEKRETAKAPSSKRRYSLQALNLLKMPSRKKSASMINKQREQGASRDAIAESESGSSGCGNDGHTGASRQSISGPMPSITLSIAKEFNLKSFFKPSFGKVVRGEVLVSTFHCNCFWPGPMVLFKSEKLLTPSLCCP